MKRFTIAIIIPVYNVEEYLEDCLKSVIDQTISFDEIIIVNDGSTDNSLKICQEYQNRYSNITNIKIISQENQGLSAARNAGLRMCLCDYVIFLDSDDALRTDAVEKLSKKISLKDYEVIAFDAEIVDEVGMKQNQNPYDRKKYLREGEMTGKELLLNMFPWRFVVSACLAMYKRKFLIDNNIFFQYGLIYEDNCFTLQLLLIVNNILYIPEGFYFRRYRQNSIMMSKINKRKVLSAFIVAGKIHELLEKEIQLSCSAADKFIALILVYYNIAINKFIEYGSDAEEDLISKLHEEKMILQDFITKENKMMMQSNNVSNVLNALMIWELYNKNDSPQKNTNDNIIIDLKENLEKIIFDIVLKKLKEIPFSEKKIKLGMYGTGKAADIILKIYEKYVCKIECNLCFVRTKAEVGGNYCGRAVYSIQDAPTDLDYICISSMKYAEEMIKNIREHYSGTADIINIFANEYLNISWKQIGVLFGIH